LLDGLAARLAYQPKIDRVGLTCFVVIYVRRRLPVVMVRSHMSETLKAAVTYIEQGRILFDRYAIYACPVVESGILFGVVIVIIIIIIIIIQCLC